MLYFASLAVSKDGGLKSICMMQLRLPFYCNVSYYPVHFNGLIGTKVF